jgi:hypothetical protein
MLNLEKRAKFACSPPNPDDVYFLQDGLYGIERVWESFPTIELSRDTPI